MGVEKYHVILEASRCVPAYVAQRLHIPRWIACESIHICAGRSSQACNVVFLSGSDDFPHQDRTPEDNILSYAHVAAWVVVVYPSAVFIDDFENLVVKLSICFERHTPGFRMYLCAVR